MTRDQALARAQSAIGPTGFACVIPVTKAFPAVPIEGSHWFAIGAMKDEDGFEPYYVSCQSYDDCFAQLVAESLVQTG